MANSRSCKLQLSKNLTEKKKKNNWNLRVNQAAEQTAPSSDL